MLWWTSHYKWTGKYREVSHLLYSQEGFVGRRSTEIGVFLSKLEGVSNVTCTTLHRWMQDGLCGDLPQQGQFASAPSVPWSQIWKYHTIWTWWSTLNLQTAVQECFKLPYWEAIQNQQTLSDTLLIQRQKVVPSALKLLRFSFWVSFSYFCK